jgi:hypothetical protein
MEPLKQIQIHSIFILLIQLIIEKMEAIMYIMEVTTPIITYVEVIPLQYYLVYLRYYTDHAYN